MLWRVTRTRLLSYLAALRTRQVERQVRREVEARRQAAADRAAHLLRSYLTPEQRETYRQKGEFVVRGQSGRRYALGARNALYYNVSELDDYGQAVLHLCAHAAVSVPISDHLLTQKLMLEHHEAEFRRVANWARGTVL